MLGHGARVLPLELVPVPGHGARVLPLELVPLPGHGAQISTGHPGTSTKSERDSNTRLDFLLPEFFNESKLYN